MPSLYNRSIDALNVVWKSRKLRELRSMDQSMVFQHVEELERTRRNIMWLREIGVKRCVCMQHAALPAGIPA